MNRTKWIVSGTVLAVVLLVAFAVFRPDKLFIDQQVDEQLESDIAAALEAAPPEPPPSVPDGAEAGPAGAGPTSAPPEVPVEPVVTAQGQFVSQNDYSVSGSVAVVTQPDGRRVLVLQDLSSDNGPDLQLYVSPSADGRVDGGTKLAPLKGNIGTQSYDLPTDVDLSALSNVVIWCERFSRAFGTASLG